MDAFETLQNYYLIKSGGGQVGTRGMQVNNARTPSDIIIEDTEVKQLKSLEKNEEAKEAEEAVETAIDHGFDPDSSEGQKKIRQLLEGIRQKNQEASSQNLEKGRPRKDPWSLPASMLVRGQNADEEAAKMAWGIVFQQDPSLKGDVRAETGPDWTPGMGPKPRGSRAWAKFSKIFERLKAKGGKKDEDSEKAIINMEKAHVSPQLARLLSAAAGWALSGDIAGKVDPHLAQEWDRASSMHDKMKLQEEMMRQMHRMHKKPQSKLMIIQRKSDDGNFLENAPAFDDLHMFYKDHAPIPPRQGLLWDAVKHRWTRPEKVGRTVWEVQGHKRFRGTGAGAHERSRKTGGSGGYGVGSSEAGRRFRSVGDVGRAHPHEAKRPGQRDLKAFKRATQPKRR
jgi:hypothetical protein